MQTFTAQDLVNTPVLSDAELTDWAQTYLNTSAINKRMTFIEFLSQPEKVSAASKHWPTRCWRVDFTQQGNIIRLWVTDLLSDKTIYCEPFHKSKAEQIVSHLDRLKASHGTPQSVIIDASKCLMNAAVIGWARAHQITSQITPASALKEVA